MALLFRRKRRESWRKKTWRKLTVSRNSKSFFINRENRRLKNFKKVLIACSVFFVVYFLFFSQFFLIREVVVKGNKSISLDSVKSVVDDELSKPILTFVPGNNFFFGKDEEIKVALLNRFSEIESVKISKKFPNTMEIEIYEKKSALVWCRADSCYYLDGNGIAFLLAKNGLKTDDRKFVRIIEQSEIEEELEDNIEVKSVSLGEDKGNDEKDSARKGESVEDRDKSGKGGKESLKPIRVGEKVSDKDFVAFALDVDRMIGNNTMLKIRYYKTKGTRTRELIAYTDKNIRLYFDTTRDAELQVKNLKDFLSKGIERKKMDFLKYIYLKVDNKIFFK
jgi:cell division septal protein FtsQ